MRLESTWGDLARAAGGRLLLGNPAEPVESISTDTRKLEQGQVFWALKGSRYDAHDMLDAALSERASGWVVERLDRQGPRPKHLVQVPNTLKGLQAFAAFHRRRFEIPIVGITGSNGKTTTKEMLKAICSRLGPTCASPGNWNNQVGVPLSVLELTSEHRYGIFELADSHPGDIDEIARISQPTLGVVTNIGPDHLEFYGSLEQNFKTKSELVENLPEEGKAVINIDDPWLAALEPRLGARAVTFGMNPRARVSFAESGEIIIDRHKLKVSLRALGQLSRYNAAAAAAAAWALGIDAETIRRGLEDYRPSAMRMELLRHPSGCEVVLDAYNANPASMKASIEAFCHEFAKSGKILVLGDMKELGATSRQFHQELGQWIAKLPLEAVYLAGPEMSEAFSALKAVRPGFEVHYGETPQAWIDGLRTKLSAQKALLFKASRAMKFESILESLQCSFT
ncbi:MAG: UDP-N-acetylmuramoyl-tripeptide--D-alanyl-D-alanine ligase [Elusimicrobia bacterium]|nr:UDP-N-acetylmuramoyl-tripeptide--D-alanyl-D-alanine ligase [Elusimicrobiota bacterium]